MLAITLQQLQETASWKRSLFLMREENIVLKNRLSEILKTRFDKTILIEMENYQSSFVNEDMLFSLLRNDLAELDLLYKDEIPDIHKKNEQIDEMQIRFRNNFIAATEQFNALQAGFNDYISRLINQPL